MLTILKGGQLVSNDWDAATKSYKRTTLTETLPYLCRTCELEEGVRFKDFLALVRKDCDLYSYLFTSGPWLKEIVEEGDKPFVRESDEVERLEIYWGAEVNKYDGSDTLEEYVSIHGIGGLEGPYALDFSPINTLTELEVRLNTEYKVYDMRSALANVPAVLTAKKSFTLLDILHGVFWELSFHGSTANRDSRLAELNQSMEDIETGKAKTIPWDEVKEKLRTVDCDEVAKNMKTVKCSECEGKGWVYTPYAHPAPEMVESRREVCLVCGGSGEVLEEE